MKKNTKLLTSAAILIFIGIIALLISMAVVEKHVEKSVSVKTLPSGWKNGPRDIANGIVVYDSANRVIEYIGTKVGEEGYWVKVYDEISGEFLAERCISQMSYYSPEDYEINRMSDSGWRIPDSDLTNPGSPNICFFGIKAVYNADTDTTLVAWVLSSSDFGDRVVAQLFRYEPDSREIVLWGDYINNEPRLMSYSDFFSRGYYIKSIDLDTASHTNYAVISYVIRHRNLERYRVQTRLVPMNLGDESEYHFYEHNPSLFLDRSCSRSETRWNIRKVSSTLRMNLTSGARGNLDIYILYTTAGGYLQLTRYEGDLNSRAREFNILAPRDSSPPPSLVTDDIIVASCREGIAKWGENIDNIIRIDEREHYLMILYTAYDKFYRKDVGIKVIQLIGLASPCPIRRLYNITNIPLSDGYAPQVLMGEGQCMITFKKTYTLNSIFHSYIFGKKIPIESSSLSSSAVETPTFLVSDGRPATRENANIVYNPNTRDFWCYWNERPLNVDVLTHPFRLKGRTVRLETREPLSYNPCFSGSVRLNKIDLSWSSYPECRGECPYYIAYILTSTGRIYRARPLEGYLTAEWENNGTSEVEVKIILWVADTSTPYLKVDPDIRSIPPKDREPPSIPTNLRAEACSETQIYLEWYASIDDVGVKDYKVYRVEAERDRLIATIIPPPTYFYDGGLEPGTTYRYKVKAYDETGNSSDFSPEVSATTPSSSGSGTPGGGGGEELEIEPVGGRPLPSGWPLPPTGFTVNPHREGSLWTLILRWDRPAIPRDVSDIRYYRLDIKILVGSERVEVPGPLTGEHVSPSTDTYIHYRPVSGTCYRYHLYTVDTSMRRSYPVIREYTYR